MTSHIKIRQAPGTWVIRAQGAVIGESSNALEVSEGSRDPVIYFPRDDIGMMFMEKSGTVTRCPHKGEATYFGVAGKSGLIADAAWSYETPNEGMEAIAGHLAFDGRLVTVEEL